MLQTYRALLRTPDLAPAILASAIGRAPIGIASLAILLTVQASADSMVVAGTTGAFYVLGLAAFAPVLGRLIDYLGPRQVSSASAFIYPASLWTLLALVAQPAPSQWIWASAFVAGASLPPVTVCMRALYPQVLPGEALLHTAYSLDAALIEAIFIAGPMLVALFASAQFPEGAIHLAGGSAIVGSFVFLRTRAVRQWRIETSERDLFGPLRDSRLIAIFACTLLFSIAFGLAEMAIIGAASRQGAPFAAGVILGVASVGSTAGALAYGARRWRGTLPRQLTLSLLAMALGMILVAPITNLYALGAAVIFAFAPVAIALAITSLSIAKIARRAMLAESFTWNATCLLIGVSTGIAAGGVLVELYTPAAAWIVAAVAALSAAVSVRSRKAD